MLQNVIIEMQLQDDEMSRLARLLSKDDKCVPCKVWLRADERRVALIRNKDKVAADIGVSESISQLLMAAMSYRIGIIEVNVNIEDKVLALSMLQDNVSSQKLCNPTDALIVFHDLRLVGMLHRSEDVIDTRCDDVDGDWDFEVKLC